jgi:hypothetical protein
VTVIDRALEPDDDQDGEDTLRAVVYRWSPFRPVSRCPERGRRARKSMLTARCDLGWGRAFGAAMAYIGMEGGASGEGRS